jgi:hypothetical protein
MELVDINLEDLLRREIGWEPKVKSGQERHGACPQCQGTDRFEVTVGRDEHDLFKCRQCGFAGNALTFMRWYKHCDTAEALTHLGVNGNSYGSGNKKKVDLSKVPDDKPKVLQPVTSPDLPPPPPKPGVYKDMADYANRHLKIPVHFLIDAGWQDTTYNNRPAIAIPSEDKISRGRFLDGTQPKFQPLTPAGHAETVKADPTKKVKAQWYKFPDCTKDFIVLCNGQPSVEVARSNGLEAFCFTDGEKAIPKHLVKRLQSALATNKGTTCIIALDGDNAGRKATIGISEQLAAYNIRLVDFGGDSGYDLADFCSKHHASTLPHLLALATVPTTAQITSSHGAMEKLEAKRKGRNQIPNLAEYPPIPFKSLHQFGGMAKVLHPKKVGIIMAPSGHGKTSLLETWADAWCRLGLDVLWRGDEWDEEEYAVRRLQRYGGMNVDQFSAWQVHQNEERLGVKGERFGKPLPDWLEKKNDEITATVKAWPGKVWYFSKRSTIEESQDEMKAMLYQLRREGRRVACVVWDYISLFRSKHGDADGNKNETVLGAIKDFAMETSLATLAGSQINKAITAQVVTDGGVKLTAADMQFARDDKTNLLIGINPKYQFKTDPFGEIETDEFGEKKLEFTKIARFQILKNSLGKPTGETRALADFVHLCWQDITN